MTTKRSRAAAAARAANGAQPARAPSTATWTRAQVETAAAVFAELPSLAFDKTATAARVAQWYRFVDVVAEGAVAPEAAGLAADVVRAGVAFLEARPEHVLVGGAVWSLANVEAMANYVGSVSGAASIDAGARAHLSAFERVVRSGLITPEARPLADALVVVVDELLAR